MAKLQRQGDVDVALATLTSAVDAAIPALTRLAATQIPEQQYSAAVTNAPTVARIEQNRAAILTSTNDLKTKAAALGVLVKAVLPA